MKEQDNYRVGEQLTKQELLNLRKGDMFFCTVDNKHLLAEIKSITETQTGSKIRFKNELGWSSITVNHNFKENGDQKYQFSTSKPKQYYKAIPIEMEENQTSTNATKSLTTYQNINGTLIFRNKESSVIRPGALVSLEKNSVIRSAIAAKMQGRQIEFADKIIDKTIKGNEMHIFRNNYEKKFSFLASIIGEVKTVKLIDEEILCTVEISSVSIDENPMLVYLKYDDLVEIEILKSFSKLQELTKKETEELKTAGYDFIHIADLSEFSQDGDLSLCAMNCHSLLPEEIEIVKEKYFIDLSEIIFDESGKIRLPDHAESAEEVTNTVAQSTGLESASNTTNEIIQQLDEIVKQKQSNTSSDMQLEEENKQIVKEKKKSEYSDSNHVMIDMETLSTEDNAAIVEIALTQFNPSTGETFKQLNIQFDVDEVLKSGYDVSKSTLIDFWMNQPHEVRQRVLVDGMRLPLETGWKLVHDFLSSIYDVRVWGKGPTFDISKMRYSMKRELYGKSLPWKYWNERCVRTIIAIDKDLAKSIEFTGSKHVAIDDTLHQIKQVSAIISKYNL